MSNPPPPLSGDEPQPKEGNIAYAKIDSKWLRKGAEVGVLLGILYLLFGAIPHWKADAAGKTGDAANWSQLLFWVGLIVVAVWGIGGVLAGAIIGAVLALLKRRR